MLKPLKDNPGKAYEPGDALEPWNGIGTIEWIWDPGWILEI